jgi:hypothetical protein
MDLSRKPEGAAMTKPMKAMSYAELMAAAGKANAADDIEQVEALDAEMIRREAAGDTR